MAIKDVLCYDRGVTVRISKLHVIYAHFQSGKHSLSEMCIQLKNKKGFSRSVLYSQMKYLIERGYVSREYLCGKIVVYQFIVPEAEWNFEDREIQKILKITYPVVKNLRSKRDLTPNKSRYYKGSVGDKFEDLYKKGYTDLEISVELAYNVECVGYLRRKRSLPPNKSKSKITLKQIEKTTTITDADKPWHDPESLYCDGDFLEQFKAGKFEESR